MFFMRFADKLSNVSFGGNWSEELVAAQQWQEILENLEWAIENCMERNVDTQAVREALEAICPKIDKGELLVARWKRGNQITNAQLRHKHFSECYQLIIHQLGRV